MYKRIVSKQTNKSKEFNISRHEVNINSLMKFGKYKFLTIKQILDRDAQYIVWCVNKDYIKLNKNVVNELINKGLIKDYNFAKNKVIE